MKNIIFGLCALAATNTTNAATLCESDEVVLFSCRTGSKVISLCSSKGLTEHFGYMQYRFGRVDLVELVFPRAKEHPGKLFTKSFATWSHGGYGASATFQIGEFEYSVYSDLALGSVEDMNKSESGDYGPRSGVSVSRRGKLLKDIRCIDDEANHDDPRQFDEKLPDFLKRGP